MDFLKCWKIKIYFLKMGRNFKRYGLKLFLFYFFLKIGKKKKYLLKYEFFFIFFKKVESNDFVNLYFVLY